MTPTAQTVTQRATSVHVDQGAGTTGEPVVLVSAPAERTIPFVMPGSVTVKPGTIPFYPRVAGKLNRVTAALAAQTSGTTVVDVLKNDVSIFSSGAHKPTITATGRSFADASQIDVTDFAATDCFTVAVDQAGSGATHLVIELDYTETL